MTKRIAMIWTEAVCRCDGKHDYKRSVILYGMEILVSTIIGVGLILTISLLTCEPLAWTFFLLAFVPLRHTAGGYHASTHFQCYAVFCSIFSAGVALEKTQVTTNVAIVVMLCVSCVIICSFSPCVPENKPLSKKRIRQNRNISIVLVIVDAFIVVILLRTDMDKGWVHYYCWGVLSAAISLVAAKIKIIIRREN